MYVLNFILWKFVYFFQVEKVRILNSLMRYFNLVEGLIGFTINY